MSSSLELVAESIDNDFADWEEPDNFWVPRINMGPTVALVHKKWPNCPIRYDLWHEDFEDDVKHMVGQRRREGFAIKPEAKDRVMNKLKKRIERFRGLIEENKKVGKNLVFLRMEHLEGNNTSTKQPDILMKALDKVCGPDSYILLYLRRAKQSEEHNLIASEPLEIMRSNDNMCYGGKLHIEQLRPDMFYVLRTLYDEFVLGKK
jgi:hypothetical protein